MQIGMIGLGRMGGNMVRRLLKGGHQCVVFDRSPKAVDDLASAGAGRLFARRLREEAAKTASHLADGARGGGRQRDRRSPAPNGSGRHPHRRRQLLLRRRHSKGKAAGVEENPLC